MIPTSHLWLWLSWCTACWLVDFWYDDNIQVSIFNLLKSWLVAHRLIWWLLGHAAVNLNYTNFQTHINSRYLDCPQLNTVKTSLMINQHWLKKWLDAVRQQAITWANVDPHLCHHMALLSHNELNQCRADHLVSYNTSHRIYTQSTFHRIYTVHPIEYTHSKSHRIYTQYIP